MSFYDTLKTDNIEMKINNNNELISHLYKTSKELRELQKQIDGLISSGPWIGSGIDLSVYHDRIDMQIGKLTHEILYLKEVLNNRSKILNESQTT